MIPIVIAVLQGVATPGINIVGMTMLLQFVVSFGFILVVNAPQNMVAYGTDTFEARDFGPNQCRSIGESCRTVLSPHHELLVMIGQRFQKRRPLAAHRRAVATQ